MSSQKCYTKKFCRVCFKVIEHDEGYRRFRKGNKNKQYVHNLCYISRREQRYDRQYYWIRILQKAAICEQINEKNRLKMIREQEVIGK